MTTESNAFGETRRTLSRALSGSARWHHPFTAGRYDDLCDGRDVDVTRVRATVLLIDSRHTPG